MTLPRKRFGQHFLHDKNYIEKIVAAINAKPNEHLVEIGPGQGALTLPVLKQVHTLDAIELDRDLIAELKSRTHNAGQLNIYSADALNFDFASLKQDERKLRLFGNLPYNISTPLIFHLLHFQSSIVDMVFMLQKEVADRIAATVNHKNYGRLSVMVQYFCKVELLFDVPPAAFFPPPKVNSSIIKLIPHVPLPFEANNFKTLEKVTQLAFNQRRKTLRNSLKSIFDDNAWQTLNILPNLRAENLSVQQFVELSNAIKD